MTIECAFFGTVGRDAEAKTSKNGKPYLRFSARDGDGDQGQWISVMYFGDDAAELGTKILKDTRVYVEGRLQLNTWDQDGRTRAGLTVMSFHCRIPAIGRNKSKSKPKPSQNAPEPEQPPANQPNDFYSDDLPF
jgi:single-stranded DNA-binding protein